jgi:hypothetical protein
MLDIRYPIGIMFVILGSLLAIYGVISDPEIYRIHSFGVNINLGWGGVLLLFGVLVLAMARRAQIRK